MDCAWRNPKSLPDPIPDGYVCPHMEISLSRATYHGGVPFENEFAIFVGTASEDSWVRIVGDGMRRQAIYDCHGTVEHERVEVGPDGGTDRLMEPEYWVEHKYDRDQGDASIRMPGFIEVLYGKRHTDIIILSAGLGYPVRIQASGFISGMY